MPLTEWTEVVQVESYISDITVRRHKNKYIGVFSAWNCGTNTYVTERPYDICFPIERMELFNFELKTGREGSGLAGTVPAFPAY